MNSSVKDTDNRPQGGSESKRRDRDKVLQKAKFYGVVSVMVTLCGGFIWFLFSPEPRDATAGSAGLNVTIPDAVVQEPEADKRKAYERQQADEQRHEKTRTLQEIAGDDYLTLQPTEAAAEPQADAIRQSQATYGRVNRQITAFYQTPREDPQVAELKRQLAEMSERLDEQSAVPKETSDPMEMMEKSYELAARYFPPGGGAASAPLETPAPERDGKTPTVRVRRAGENVTSTLAEPAPLTLEERNWNFLTADGNETPPMPGTAIRACVAEDQTVTAGARVKLRLLEPLQAGDAVIAANTPLYCVARMDGQRLSLSVTSIESGGNIVPVSLSAYDTDGQLGLFVPNTAERTALKEAAASVGAGLGNSFSLSQNAGTQIASDLTRGVLAGGSQYLSSKLREVKITLKAGYRILLVSNDK